MQQTKLSGLRDSRVALFNASVLALFVELVLIRWVPSVVHVVGFFANVVLIASFLGLGVGMMRAREDSAATGALRLSVLVATLALYRMARPSVGLGGDSGFGINELVFADRISVPLPVILIGVFGLVAWTLVPFGRLVAAVFDDLERIPAYTINIAGSLAGVALFTVISAIGAPSALWFALAFLIVGVYAGWKATVIPAVLVAVSLGAAYRADIGDSTGEVLWSPYNQLRVRAVGDNIDDGFTIDVNNQFLLSGFDLSPDAVHPPGLPLEDGPKITSLVDHYNFPSNSPSPTRF